MKTTIVNSLQIYCVNLNNELYPNYGISTKGDLYKKDRYGYWTKIFLHRQNKQSVTNTVVRFNGANAILSTLIAETLDISDVEAKGMVERLNAIPVIDTYKEVS